MQILRVQPATPLWESLIDYAQNCSWIAGPHMAQCMRENNYSPWEAIFAALDGETICGYCTLMEYDYYPENRYHPWISSMFVDEKYRGHRLSEKLISAAEAYARSVGFEYAYIPSDITGLYEKYGYELVDTLVNYGGDTDNVFRKKL